MKSEICRAVADLMARVAELPDNCENDDAFLSPILNDIENAKIGVDIILRNKEKFSLTNNAQEF